MKISIINGSPKPGKSTSELLIQYLTRQIHGHDVSVYNISKLSMTETQIKDVTKSDALVLAFPLYVDSIPSHLLKLLVELEKEKFAASDIRVYCIVNNGFFEGIQNHIAVAQMKHWCERTGLTWGQAAGIGAGEMLPYISNVPLGHGPNKNIGHAINDLAENLLKGTSGEDIFVSPNWPRFLWKLQATWFVWRPRAKANGLKARDLCRRMS